MLYCRQTADPPPPGQAEGLSVLRHPHHDLAERAVALDTPIGVGDRGEIEGAVDHWQELAFGQERRGEGMESGDEGRLRSRPRNVKSEAGSGAAG